MRSPLAALILLALSTGPAATATLEIDWGTAASFERLVVSDGTPFNPSNFRIELGAFEAGFTPTAGNMSEWIANWKVFDAITDPDFDPLDFAELGLPDTGRFAGNAHLDSSQTSLSEDATPGATFAAGTQAYLFIRNQDTLGPDAEWGLFTQTAASGDDEPWTFPSVDGSQEGFNPSWTLNAADTAIAGAANDNAISGAGTSTDPSLTFALRTHQVPEPTLPALLAVAAAIGLRRRPSRRELR